MSYYNYCFVPCKTSKDEANSDHLIFDSKDDGFDNMIQLLELDADFVQSVEFSNLRYVVFEPVRVGNDVIRPADLNWNWHNRKCFYSDADCFIFVVDLHERILESVEQDKDFLESLGRYQNGIKKYGKNLVIFPL